MAPQKDQPVIDALMDEILELREENDRLKAEIRRRGGVVGNSVVIQRRTCIGCSRNLPDGPEYFPGYFEDFGADSAAEARRHYCIYCRAEGR